MTRNLLSRFSKKFDHTDKIAAAFIILMLAIIFIAFIQSALRSSEITARNIFGEKAEAAELPTGTIEDLKDDVLNRLSKCESGGAAEPDALVTFDPDHSGKARNLPSLGRFQFKVPTIVYYAQKLQGRKITDLEAIQIATSPIESRKLASQIIFEEGALDNWLTCTRTNDLKTLVNFINAHV